MKVKPRYIGPFGVIDKVSKVEYRLAFSERAHKHTRYVPCILVEEVSSRTISCSQWGRIWIKSRIIIRRKTYWDRVVKHKRVTPYARGRFQCVRWYGDIMEWRGNLVDGGVCEEKVPGTYRNLNLNFEGENFFKDSRM